MITNKIVASFSSLRRRRPTQPAANRIPANPCLFLWGTFQFVGLVESYNETLDFFSASGVPLRATVSMSLTESRYKVADIPQQRAWSRRSRFRRQPRSGRRSSAAGMDPTDWRETALANGMETPRFASVGRHQCRRRRELLRAVAGAAGGAGFSVGGSAISAPASPARSPPVRVP